MKSALCLLITLLLVPTAFAQSKSEGCGCNAALAKDMVSIIKSEKQQYAFLNIIDQKMYEELKKDASATATIPIAEALIKGSANYSEFQIKRTEYFNKVQYSASAEESYQEFQLVTSPVAYKEWGICMDKCLKKDKGLFILKESEDKDAVIAKVYWYGPAGSSTTPITGSILGGSVAGADAGKLFPDGTTILNGGSIPLIIVRETGKTIRAVVSASGDSDSLYAAWGDATSINTGKLILERPSAVETKIEDRCQVSGWTDNNHDEDCSGGACSPDGKYRASVRTVTFTAPANHVLRNGRFNRCWWRCGGLGCLLVKKVSCPDGSGNNCVEGGGPCGGWWSNDGINSTNGETLMTGTYRAWSWPTIREFCADLIRRDTNTDKDEVAVQVPSTGTFIFSVPSGYSSAVLEYQIKGTKGVMKAGTSKTPDGLLELLYSTQPTTGGTIYYQYKIL